jgi:hypothetical protein
MGDRRDVDDRVCETFCNAMFYKSRVEIGT